MSYTPLNEIASDGIHRTDMESNGSSVRTPSLMDRPRSALASFRPSSRAAGGAPELSVPLTTDEDHGARNGGRNQQAGDPYYVFRDDLQRKLESVDDSLSEFLRIVHQTVGSK